MTLGQAGRGWKRGGAPGRATHAHQVWKRGRGGGGGQLLQGGAWPRAGGGRSLAQLALDEVSRLLHSGDLAGALLVQLQQQERGGSKWVDGRRRAGAEGCAQQGRTRACAPPLRLRAWISNFSSSAIMISTVSRESAPRSTNLDSAATCGGSGRGRVGARGVWACKQGAGVALLLLRRRRAASLRWGARAGARQAGGQGGKQGRARCCPPGGKQGRAHLVKALAQLLRDDGAHVINHLARAQGG